jgi:hypothetical protein
MRLRIAVVAAAFLAVTLGVSLGTVSTTVAAPSPASEGHISHN